MGPLPDPLVCADGVLVREPSLWQARRRPELLAAFSSEMYGRTALGRPDGMRFEILSTDPFALGGRATRREVSIRVGPEPDAPRILLLLYVPKGGAPGRRWPAFVGINFFGNQTVHPDPRITAQGAAERGSKASKWQVETVLSRGYATATLYCDEVCPDVPDGLAEGVVGWFERKGSAGRAPDAWGALGAWAWGLSRALDYLDTDPDIDASRVAVHGHSRMGKAALWAGAQDERFALVISNDSGCGGASLSRHGPGETVAQINHGFPHWYCLNFRKYGGNEAALPVDQHELLALIAPRPLYVASAEDDAWADPRGEFLAALAADPAYGLFGLKGVGVREMPPVNHPVGERIRYHIRTGPHDMTAYDWSCYLDFADKHLAG